MENDMPSDLAPVIEAAGEFASYPGPQTDAAAKDFLDRFPLPVLFSVLQTNVDVPRAEEMVVACLERIFKTKYGASLISQYSSFIRDGLHANSESVKYVSCKAMYYMLENTKLDGSAVHVMAEYDMYPLLVDCLVYGNEHTSAAALDAIKSLAQTPGGLSIVFPDEDKEHIHLKNVAVASSSLGKVRILSLITKLFALSTSVASSVYEANLLSLFETEINVSTDTLSTLNALELLYELVECSHSAKFMSKTTLLQMLTDMIRNSSTDPILRSRAMLIGGRLLSSADAYTVIDEKRIKHLISAVTLMLQSQDNDECEISLETLGLIGASTHGAALLLSSSSPVAGHVVDVAFDRHGRVKQLAALYALGIICGVDRTEELVLLNESAEECLKSLLYAYAASSPKLTPSGLLLSLLKQDSEIRLAGYRLISSLVARRWCLVDICSRLEFITLVTDATTETTKNVMEARHGCCVAISKALSASGMAADPSVAETAGKLQEAVRRGPYVASKRNTEAVPIVMTAERF